MLRINLFDVSHQEMKAIVLTPEAAAQQTCLIGRAATCELFLDSIEVSRIHGKIHLQNERYHYTDLGSANGSYLNNERIAANQDFCLQIGDAICIGDFLMLIEAIEPPLIENVKSNQNQPDSKERLRSQFYQQSNHQNNSSGNNLENDLTVRCVRITDETPDVKTFTFVAEPAIAFEYNPGQFVTLELEINGETVLRSYSVSSPPSRPHTLEITVKRVPAPADAPQAPPGLVSNWLHDHLQVGDRVKLNGVLGKFTCAPNPAPKLLMISAGSGITPMMSMSRWLADTAATTDIVFFHATRTPGDIIFRQELELMAARLSNFNLAVSVTQPPAGQPWLGYRGRLTEAMLHLIAPDFLDRTVYVCGPDGFMQSVKTLLQRLSFPLQNYYEESFGGAKATRKAKPVALRDVPPAANSVLSIPAARSTQPIVHFAQSETEAIGDGTESILELAEQVNVKIRSNCRQGVCGACKKRKLEGSIRYESDPDGLRAEDQAAGFVLTCIAMPVDRVVVEA